MEQFLLPDGRALFLGSTGHNAYYTPSGNTSPGVWTAAPDFPNAQGTPDAPAAVMVNGKVICTTSPIPTNANHFPSPTSFYEFDYLTNTFTQLTAPGGGSTIPISCYLTNMLALPDGNILYSRQGSNQYYLYTPSGLPLASGKPVISNITSLTCTDYKITGTGFNGISQGATYGDDWQMNSNYPIIRLTSGALKYYARSYNWNSTGVMRGLLPDTTYFTLPAGLPYGTYSLEVVANGFASNPVSFTNGVSPTVNISSSAGTLICSGTSTTLTAIATNGGASPNYQWYRNNALVSGGSTFSTTLIGNNDSIKCTLTSNAACIVPGSNPVNSNTLKFTSTYCIEDISLKVNIQGYYNPSGDTMTAVIDPNLYPTITDSVTLQLADSVTKTIISSDKKVVNTHGIGTFHLTGILPGHRYYLVIRTRNSIETWSKNTYLFTSPAMNFDLVNP